MASSAENNQVEPANHNDGLSSSSSRVSFHDQQQYVSALGDSTLANLSIGSFQDVTVLSMSTQIQDNDVSTQSASVSVSSRDNIDPSRPAELSRRCWGLDRPTWTHLLNDWWFWETGSVLLSCACIVAAVIILVRISGTPIRNWAFPIQPNSLISVFMTIAKSSILVPASRSISRAKWTRFRQSPHPIVELENYDEASRGR